MKNNLCYFDIPIRLEEVIEAIRDKCNPEDVFNENELGQWALENGYVEKPPDER